MHFGIDIPPLGLLAEPANVLRLAEAAEASGWEAVSTWDHLGFVCVGAGGEARQFEALGEIADLGVRGRLLDEALEVLDPLLRGEPVTHDGAYPVHDLAGRSFDVVVLGVSEPGELDVDAYAAAGLTWFLEGLHPKRPFDELLARVEAGPPA